MSSDPLPPRLRRSSFERYESVIATIVREHPSPVPLCPPKGLSVITFAARLRDAILSLHRYDWVSSKVDKEKFHLIVDDIGIFHKPDGSVVGGSRKHTRARVDLAVAPEPLTQGPIIDVLLDSDRQLICYLASLSLVHLPLTVRGITPTDAKVLEDNYDVVLKLQPDGTTIIT